MVEISLVARTSAFLVSLSQEQLTLLCLLKQQLLALWHFSDQHQAHKAHEVNRPVLHLSEASKNDNVTNEYHVHQKRFLQLAAHYES